MKATTIVSGLAAVLLMTATSMAQTDQNAAGTGGASKPGVQGSSGSESGASTSTTATPAPAVPPTSGSSEPKAGSKVSPLPAPDSSTQAGQEKGTPAGSLKSQDESKVQGMPGGKSGPSNK
jgi:hypothetical protein